MKTKFKKILNLTKSLKTKTSLSCITLTFCLISTFFYFPIKNAFGATWLQPSIFQKPLEYAFEGASTKEIFQCILFLFLLAVLADIKRLIQKRKLKKEEASQANQSPESQETEETQSSAEAQENDDNENSEQ